MNKLFFIIFLIAVVFSGCSKNTQNQSVDSSSEELTVNTESDSTDSKNQTSVTSGKGTLTLYITDKPPELNIEKVFVTISGIMVNRDDGNEDNADDQENEESTWIEFKSEPQTFELLSIQDVQEFLGTSQLDEGIYTQIRLDVDEAVAVIDGTEQVLDIPSGTLKLVRSFSINEGNVTSLILDFDAEQSIHIAGSKYIMRPAIKIIGNMSEKEDSETDSPDDDSSGNNKGRGKS